MHSNTALAKLAKKIVLAEIEKRGAKDANAVESIVGRRLRLDSDGDIIMVDPEGRSLPGLGLADALDALQRSQPELFRSSVAALKTAARNPNPFAPGADFSMTAQMLLWRSDPEKAETLAAEAGLTINRTI